MANNPIFGAAVGAAFLLCWQLFVWPIGIIGGIIMAARTWHWLQKVVLAWCICSQEHPADFEEL